MVWPNDSFAARYDDDLDRGRNIQGVIICVPDTKCMLRWLR